MSRWGVLGDRSTGTRQNGQHGEYSGKLNGVHWLHQISPVGKFGMPSCRAHAIEFVVNYEQLRPDRLCKIGQGKEFARRASRRPNAKLIVEPRTSPRFVGKKMGRQQPQFRASKRRASAFPKGQYRALRALCCPTGP